MSEEKVYNLRSISVISSTVCAAAGSGIVYTFSLPATYVGPLPAFLMCVLIAIINIYSIDIIVKHLFIRDKKMNDEILADNYPKYRFIILLCTRFSCFVLYAVYVISNFLYMHDGLNSLIFSHTNVSNGAQIGITFVIILGLTLIINPSFAALVAAVGVIVPIFNLATMIYYGPVKASADQLQCFYDAWKHPGNYGKWNVSTKEGWWYLLAFGGQYIGSYYLHNSVPSILAAAKKPSKNRKNITYAFIVLMIIYFVSAMVGQIPYSCYQGEGDNLPPSDYIELFGTSTFGRITTFIFLFGLVCNTPFTYVVFNEISFNFVKFKSYKQKVTLLVIFNTLVVIISAIIDWRDVTIQTLLQIGSVGCAIIWIAILPIVIGFTSEDYIPVKSKIYTIIMALITIVITVLQFNST